MNAVSKGEGRVRGRKFNSYGLRRNELARLTATAAALLLTGIKDPVAEWTSRTPEPDVMMEGPNNVVEEEDTDILPDNEMVSGLWFP